MILIDFQIDTYRVEFQISTSITAPALIGGDQGDSINYTIIMDNAPGPSNSDDLRLTLAPNPTAGLITTEHIY